VQGIWDQVMKTPQVAPRALVPPFTPEAVALNPTLVGWQPSMILLAWQRSGKRRGGVSKVRTQACNDSHLEDQLEATPQTERGRPAKCGALPPTTSSQRTKGYARNGQVDTSGSYPSDLGREKGTSPCHHSLRRVTPEGNTLDL
jgi:hypothetical protein